MDYTSIVIPGDPGPEPGETRDPDIAGEHVARGPGSALRSGRDDKWSEC
jgi:hypothetical protein